MRLIDYYSLQKSYTKKPLPASSRNINTPPNLKSAPPVRNTLLLTLVLPLTTLANLHISDSIWFLPSGGVYSHNMACPSNYVRIFGSFSPFSVLPQAIQRLYTPK